MEFLKTGFFIGKYTDCVLKGDIDRSVEIVQNIIENAISLKVFGEVPMPEVIKAADLGCISAARSSTKWMARFPWKRCTSACKKSGFVV